MDCQFIFQCDGVFDEAFFGNSAYFDSLFPSNHYVLCSWLIATLYLKSYRANKYSIGFPENQMKMCESADATYVTYFR